MILTRSLSLSVCGTSHNVSIKYEQVIYQDSITRDRIGLRHQSLHLYLLPHNKTFKLYANSFSVKSLCR